MDNAFEKARAAYGTGAYDDATLEFLFHQLKESEDERIIKHCIFMLRGCLELQDGRFSKEKVKEDIAWLEKQKEPDKCPKYCVRSHCMGCSIYEKQKEQKPAEWSEEDERMLWGFTAYIPNEELERLGVTRDDILKKLKSLRPQPIQLKEAYKDGFQTARHAMALAFMNNLDENRPKGKMSLSNGECEDIDKAFKEGDWAKIMRYVEKYSPHWKPSEEQMNRLFSIVAALRKDYCDDMADFLANLYADLKKL